MKLTLVRKSKTDTTQMGEIYINDVYYKDTLERLDTLINVGSYGIDVYYSPRFKHNVLLLKGKTVDGRYIEIHEGNSYVDTRGCILIGTKYGADMLTSSKVALMGLIDVVIAIQQDGEKIVLDIQQ